MTSGLTASQRIRQLHRIPPLLPQHALKGKIRSPDMFSNHRTSESQTARYLTAMGAAALWSALCFARTDLIRGSIILDLSYSVY